MKRLYFLVVLTLLPIINTMAQCAMCRSTVANNVSNGQELSLAAGLNFGIIYLLATPYVLIGLIAFIWFRKARMNKNKREIRTPINFQ